MPSPQKLLGRCDERNNKEIDAKNIIGLTATPPSSDEGESYECYTALLGEIDFQLPTPAVVKDGMLSPYQDLVYFCIPTQEELKFIEETHERYKKLIEKFDKKDCDFYNWIEKRIVERKLVSGEKQAWTKFINSDRDLPRQVSNTLLKMAASFPGT